MTTRATPPGGPRPAKRTRRRTPRSVPVASRDHERREAQAAKAAKAGARVKPGFFQRDIASLAILITVLLLILLAIAVPLRNYYEGRGEIARAQASIEALEAEKARLERDIARYQDKDFADQEARRRLSVLEEGETQWRIIDPRMTAQNPAITTEDAEVVDDRMWAEVLWDSLREVEAPEAEEARVPEEAPAPAPPVADQPAP